MPASVSARFTRVSTRSWAFSPSAMRDCVHQRARRLTVESASATTITSAFGSGDTSSACSSCARMMRRASSTSSP